MALSTVYELFECEHFRKRVQAALLNEGFFDTPPEIWYQTFGQRVAANPPIVEAFEYGKNSRPYHSSLGLDPSIIPDKLIVTAVQEVLNG